MISQEKRKWQCKIDQSLHYWAITSCISGKSFFTSFFFSTINPIGITTVSRTAVFQQPFILSSHTLIANATALWKQLWNHHWCKCSCLQFCHRFVDHDYCSPQSFCKTNENLQMLTFYKTIMCCCVLPSSELPLKRHPTNDTNSMMDNGCLELAL